MHRHAILLSALALLILSGVLVHGYVDKKTATDAAVAASKTATAAFTYINGVTREAETQYKSLSDESPSPTRRCERSSNDVRSDANVNDKTENVFSSLKKAKESVSSLSESALKKLDTAKTTARTALESAVQSLSEASAAKPAESADETADYTENHEKAEAAKLTAEDARKSADSATPLLEAGKKDAAAARKGAEDCEIYQHQIKALVSAKKAADSLDYARYSVDRILTLKNKVETGITKNEELIRATPALGTDDVKKALSEAKSNVQHAMSDVNASEAAGNVAKVQYEKATEAVKSAMSASSVEEAKAEAVKAHNAAESAQNSAETAYSRYQPATSSLLIAENKIREAQRIIEKAMSEMKPVAPPTEPNAQLPSDKPADEKANEGLKEVSNNEETNAPIRDTATTSANTETGIPATENTPENNGGSTVSPVAPQQSNDGALHTASLTRAVTLIMSLAVLCVCVV